MSASGSGEGRSGEGQPGAGEGLPRLLTIMGSGETSPTMVKVHRACLARLGPAPVPAVVLDTPFGFQENADDIVARAQTYFSDSVGAKLELASLRHGGSVDRLERAAFAGAVSGARFVFAGPGSPSYALGVWAESSLPSLLADKLRSGGGGGAVTFASAAALTVGVSTVPVYEIYKAGEAPRWLAGMDLLALAGLHAAVIPHYNNAEGGNHDTRYCYLGERRLSRMETELAEGAFVLGVDEHTALMLDLDAGSAAVAGLGVVTVRARGHSAVFESGRTVPIAELAQVATELAAGGRVASVAAGEVPGGEAVAGGAPAGAGGEAVAGAAPAGPTAKGGTAGPAGEPGSSTSPLLTTVGERRSDFSAAVSARNVDGAVRAILDLDDELVAWSRDTLQSDEADRARDVLHSMVLSLGQLATVGARDPRQVVGPFVEALLDQRAKARATKRFEDADELRDQLVDLGIEVRDTTNGVEWLLGAGSHGGG